MKRNFLLTLLLTLLPFVGWAQSETVATIGGVGYGTLQDAIDAVTTDQTIVLENSIVVAEGGFALGGSTTGTTTTPNSYTIDLNGKNITFSSYTPASRVFELKRSNLDVIITNSKTEGGQITGTGNQQVYDEGWSMILVGFEDVEGSSLTIDKGVTVKCTNAGTILVACPAASTGEKKNTLNIKGAVTTESNFDFTVGTNGTYPQKGAEINVFEGATITGQLPVYLPSGICNITGGELTGTEDGIVVKSGVLNISGGTITSTATNVAAWSYNNNGAEPTGDALQVENVGYPEGAPVVNITGGKFVSASGKAVGSYAKEGMTAVTKFLKGGNYSSNPENLVALGFKVEETGSDPDITYNVVPKAPGQVYNVTVSGINGQTKAYGEPLELSVSLITTDQNTINGNPEYMNQVKSLLELEDDLQFAKANTSPTYRFRLAKDVSPTTVVEEDGHYVYTFGTDYINVPTNETGDFDRYIVKPTGSGSITITKAESNTLGNTVLATDLTYNAEERNLVATAATAEFGTPKYWATTDKDVTAATIPASAEWVEAAALKEMNAGDYYVFVKVDGNDNYPGVDAQAAADPNKVTIAQNTPDYATNAEYQPTGNAFVFDNANHPLAVAPTAKAIGTYKYFASDKDKDHVELPDVETEAGAAQWSENIPQGKDDKTYVYWYVVGNNNVLGVAPAPSQVVTASIEAAPVTLDLAENTGDKIRGIEEEYLWKGEGVDITIPNGNNVVADPANLGGTIRYFIQKRADDTETFTGNEDKNYTMKVNKLGTYRVGADYKGIAGYVNDATLETTKYFEFEVVKPTLTIKINATPEVVGVGAVPTITWTPDWEEKGTDNVTAATDIHYSYYRVEGGNVSTIATPSNQLQVGNTYQVTTNKNNFTTTYHEVVIVPAQILVAPSEVQATIADNVTLVYGQRDLPLQLTYFSGFGEGDDAAKAKENFNKTSWTNGQFVATNNDTQEAYKLYYGKIVRINNNYWIEGSYAVKVGESVPNASSGNRKALPVGTYTVSANFESGNNAIIAKTGQWTVVAKSIANNNDVAGGDFTVNNIGDNFSLTKTYIGAQIVPTAADLLTIGDRYKGINYRYNAIVEGTDYEIVGPTDPTANINAGTGKFTVKGKGNFQGEKTLEFTIDRAEITVLPVKNPELTWAIGSNNTSYYTKIDYDDLERKLLGRDNKTVNKYSDFDVRTAQGFVDLRVRRLAPESVGRYVKGAEAYLPAGKEEAQNYKFKPGTAPLTVTKGKINLRVKPIVEAEYNGTSTPDFAFDFDVAEGSTLSEVLLDNDNWKTLIGTPGNPTWNAQTKQWNIVWDLEAIKEGDDRYVATKTYTVDYNPDKAPELLGAKKNSEKMVANNYEVTVLPSATVAGKDICRGNAYVTEANIEFTVLPQNVAKEAEVVKAVKFDGADATVKITAGGYKTGDDNYKNFVVDQITVTGNNLTLAQVAENKVNKNYKVKVNPGTWGLAPTDEILELKSTEDDLAKLETKRLVETVKLTLLQPEMKKNDGTIEKFQWLKNEWHALVLPFDAKVSEISNAFGYAIVNVVNPDGASEGDVVFKMPEVTEMIKANTPFCVKVAKDIFDNDPETTKVTDKYTATFELDREADEDQGFLVVDPQGTHVSIAADNGDFGYTFDGTYVEKLIKKNEYYLRFLGKNSKWSKIGATSNAVFDMQPYTGYVNLGEGFTGTREVNFIFEEEDGSTTVIKDVDFMNGNKANAEGLYRVDGIKLQSAPTQKGVYIQDGKKFVK